jgi:hypothetical protein
LLVNRNSGRCLSVAGGAAEPGAKIVQGPVPSKSGPGERWTLVGDGKAFLLRNEQSGLVMTAISNIQRGSPPVQKADTGDKEHQRWRFEPIEDAYLLHAGSSELVLGVAESALEEGARVIQWTYVPNVDDQLWLLRSPKDVDDAVVAGQDSPPADAESGTLLQGWRTLLIFLGAALAAALVICFLMLRRRTRQPEFAALACPGCGTKLRLSPEMAAKKVKCPQCGGVVQCER